MPTLDESTKERPVSTLIETETSGAPLASKPPSVIEKHDPIRARELRTEDKSATESSGFYSRLSSTPKGKFSRKITKATQKLGSKQSKKIDEEQEEEEEEEEEEDEPRDTHPSEPQFAGHSIELKDKSSAFPKMENLRKRRTTVEREEDQY